ncbi:HPr(Ser) kinase/phosphatase [Spiroplasma endosymbiont of Virgichneumon dumeticola]|uniref:HPr(Ser) kinase/phosphatase n=1 Tax=Spiroplasma endosymbiont of Virgichneumon dumeticola TaxID=3139323 RepID=UPI0035C92A3E
MNNFTINEIVEKFNLKVLHENSKEPITKRVISSIGTNRGGLELTGFKTKQVSRSRRIILLSSKESEYIASLEKNDYNNHFKNILEDHIPGIFVTPNFKYIKELCAFAQEINSTVPIIAVPFFTSEFAATVSIYIVERLAEIKRVHGTLVNIFGYGVLIMGESGIGKSETTLELIRNGHLFIGDDSIDILKINNKLVGKVNPPVKNLIEIRGIGILDVTKMYGYHVIMHESQINLIISLNRIESEGWSKIDRLGDQNDFETYFEIKIPKTIIPVSPGRNLADLIESAVISLKLKNEGQDATSQFQARIISDLTKK